MGERKPYFGHIDHVAPAQVRAADGWRGVDIRFVLPVELELAHPAAVFKAVFPPGAEHQVHTHPDADEFVVVLSGRAVVGAGGEERTADAGTIQLIPAGVTHWLRNVDPNLPVEVVGGYLGVRTLQEAGYHHVSGGTSGSAENEAR